jgi:hypothetical protein|tara:strand:+ start:247 stop:417 length:171 start_codon:yes stop_codon:yes gene_type:complete
MDSSFELENKHKISKEQLNNMNDYYDQALMGTINLSIGIVITSIMIIKSTFINKNV